MTINKYIFAQALDITFFFSDRDSSVRVETAGVEMVGAETVGVEMVGVEIAGAETVEGMVAEGNTVSMAGAAGGNAT